MFTVFPEEHIVATLARISNTSLSRQGVAGHTEQTTLGRNISYILYIFK